MQHPQFISFGEDDARFFALAYVPGFYEAPSGKTRDEAFLILRFSRSAGFTTFSLATEAPDGSCYHYSRGTDELDSAEYTMFRAWMEEKVPFHAWRFYPTSAVDDAAFGSDSVRAEYQAARFRVAHIIIQARMRVWTQQQFPVKPFFYFDEADFPEPMAETSEMEDISRYVAGGAHA